MPLFKKPKYRKIKKTKKDRRGIKRTVFEREPVKEQIEKWPDIKELEMEWGKHLGRGLVGVAAPEQRGERRVRADKELAGKFYFSIHTHPAPREPTPTALPGYYNVERFLSLYKMGKTKTAVIASLTPKRKVKGYTLMKLRKEIDKTADQMKRKVAEIDPQLAETAPWAIDSIKLWKHLQKIGFKFKFIPMKGYFFDKNRGIFKRKSLLKRAFERLKK